MSTPVRRYSPAVYRRRRLVVLLILVAIAVAVVWFFVRLGASTNAATASKTPAPSGTNSPVAAVQSPVATGEAPQACDPSNVKVTAVTDKTVYDAGQLPKLSMTVVNTGTVPCSLNVGTKVQTFTITSGSEKYWESTDCQKAASDQQISLTPGVMVSSTTPISWDRTRSSTSTCDGAREAVPADGASYRLQVGVSGISSTETQQFILN